MGKFDCIFAPIRNNGTCKREKLGKYEFKKKAFSSIRACDGFCKDYIPSPWCKRILETWVDAVHFKEQLKAEDGEYCFDSRYVAYVVNGEKDVWYHVRYADFYNGNLIRPDGKFNAYEKVYYKRVKRYFGYKLITEKVDGVELK
jgi:hypothetical protein